MSKTKMYNFAGLSARTASMTGPSALRSNSSDLLHSANQRLEVLESRLGVERHDLLARQAEIKHEVASGDQLGNAMVQDV